MIKLSIIIVNWNTEKLLMQCINSLVSGIKYQVSSIEIIIVDNGSTDGSVEAVKKYLILNTGYSIHLIENQSNLGFAKGNNIGIKQAKGEYIMLLNSDTVVKDGAVGKLVETFEKLPDSVGAISPLLINSDGSVQKDPCFLKYPTPLLVLFYYNSILKNLVLKFFPELLFSITDFSKQTFIDQLPGAAIMIRKKVLNKIGGFDENFRIYFEDSDLCFRMKKAGYELLLEPSAKIVHLGKQSIKPLIDKEGIEKFYLLNFESLFRFCKKHYSFVKYQTVKMIILKQMLITLKFGLFKKLSAFK